jgi:hypothetical protein
MSRDNEVDLLDRKGEGVEMNTILREALSPDRNPRRKRQAEKFGKVVRRHARPVEPEPEDPDLVALREQAAADREEAASLRRRAESLRSLHGS